MPDVRRLHRGRALTVAVLARFDVPCSECDGAGWVTEATHGCGGDELACLVTCPVPSQEPCPRCNGKGTVEVW